MPQPKSYRDAVETRVERAFHDWLMMGPGRNFKDLIAQYRPLAHPPTKRITTLKEWSAQYGWVEKAEAYDREIMARERRAYERELHVEILRRRKHRLVIAEAIRAKAVKAVSLLDPALLARRPTALVALLNHIDSGERKDLGQPDTHVSAQDAAQVSSVDYSLLSDEELDQIERILQKTQATQVIAAGDPGSPEEYDEEPPVQ